jgi:hypothetical protein
MHLPKRVRLRDRGFCSLPHPSGMTLLAGVVPGRPSRVRRARQAPLRGSN